MPDTQEWGDEPDGMYGCLFCRTGMERYVAQRMTQLDGVTDAFAVAQMKHCSREGVKSMVETIMMPGYVFFIARPDFETYLIYRNIEPALRLLTEHGAWALQGRDLSFAEWLARSGGMLGVSKVYREGERVVVAEGPLKDLQGSICKVDRHNRNGQVEINFGGKRMKVWLAFEYIVEDKR